jgi:hypothetical protein
MKHERLGFEALVPVVPSATVLICAGRGVNPEQLERLDQLGDYRYL